MDGKGLEHALQRLPGAARVGGDGEFRRHALRDEKFADTAGVREAPPGERTFAVAAGGLLGGLAMSEEKKSAHANLLTCDSGAPHLPAPIIYGEWG